MAQKTMPFAQPQERMEDDDDEEECLFKANAVEIACTYFPISYSLVRCRFSHKAEIGYRDILLNLEVGWTIKYVCMCVCNGACMLASRCAWQCLLVPLCLWIDGCVL